MAKKMVWWNYTWDDGDSGIQFHINFKSPKDDYKAAWDTACGIEGLDPDEANWENEEEPSQAFYTERIGKKKVQGETAFWGLSQGKATGPRAECY